MAIMEGMDVIMEVYVVEQKREKLVNFLLLEGYCLAGIGIMRPTSTKVAREEVRSPSMSKDAAD